MVVPVKVDIPTGHLGWGTVGPPSFGNRNSGIMVGRTLVDLGREYIPVRVANLALGKQKFRKGLELAVCEPVANVTLRACMITDGEQSSDVFLPGHLKP